MEFLKKDELKETQLLGRVVTTAYGSKKKATVEAGIQVGFATFEPKYGKMIPHYHEEEMMFVLRAKDAFVRFGPEKDKLDTRVKLEPGHVLCARDGEWHVFEFDAEDGVLEIVAIFGVPENHVVE